ncbi:FadR/GntR family transcriptional regulator [Microbacterium sp. che218]|uniref:FadR/GntR family transcriptional regulator n=1 Tax=Microbacterium sp. che218 TaxID=3140649 RepID=UPI003367580A
MTTGSADAAAAPALSSIVPLSASDAVRARLCLAIELGLLLPGAHLPSDQRAADAFGVSTATVRRVFETLSEEGLLERRRGRNGGTFVSTHADISNWANDPAVVRLRSETPTVRALIAQRALIESSLAAEAAWHRDDPAALDHLSAARQASADASAAEDWSQFHEADVRFHRAMAAAALQDWALDAHRTTADALYGYFVPYPIEYLRGSNDEHLAILAAVEAGDAERAATLAREHVLELRASMFISARPSGIRSS